MKLLIRSVCLSLVAMTYCGAQAPVATSPSAIVASQIQTTPGRPIPATFLGLSHEWGVGQDLAGSSATGVNRFYRQLLQNLTAYGSGPIIIRVGGNSTDNTGPVRNNYL